MELSRILVRAVFAYVCAVALVRLTGLRTVKEANTSSFVFAVVLGDIFDDLFWAEVSAAQFVAAAGTLTICHVWSTLGHTAAGHRTWKAQSAADARQ